MEVADTGKPYLATLEDELPPIVDQVRFFAGAARLLGGVASGEYLEGVTSGIRREPVGVCGQITPWNYPLMMAVWKWAPALAGGNTMVLKPSEQTPASTVRMAELLGDVLPAGVLNVVLGGAATGSALVGHPEVPWCRSPAAPGRAGRVARAAPSGSPGSTSSSGGTRRWWSSPTPTRWPPPRPWPEPHFNAGQDCTAATRVLVERGAHDALVAALCDEATAAMTGDPYDEHTDFGPLVSADHLAKVAELERLPSGPSWGRRQGGGPAGFFRGDRGHRHEAG